MNENPPGPEGLLLIDKPAGPTSHDIVNRIRRALGTRRVGHCGTLDPFATGLLLVCVGRATRLSRFAGDGSKLYRGIIRLGIGTDTDDITGSTIATSESPPPPVERIRACAGEMLGELMQVPPAFSAKKVGGVPAYRAARRGRTPDLKPVGVRVFSFNIVDIAGPLVTFEVLVSPGTYVRSLARDLGGKLGIPACLETLRRCSSGSFQVADALQPDLPAALLLGGLIPIDNIPLAMPDTLLSRDEGVRFCNGLAVDRENPIGTSSREGGRARVLDAAGGFLGIAQVDDSAGVCRLRPEVVLGPREGPGDPSPARGRVL